MVLLRGTRTDIDWMFFLAASDEDKAHETRANDLSLITRKALARQTDEGGDTMINRDVVPQDTCASYADWCKFPDQDKSWKISDGMTCDETSAGESLIVEARAVRPNQEGTPPIRKHEQALIRVETNLKGRLRRCSISILLLC
ncbi:hypothetical protein GcM1_200037 [Golovinomyces cichoracearum]|uniref:Uncharacterized protein n=1 Tax=Golovinomyces cichoracearum TaxID=62708 RepID=A0A420IYP9_9PEZI|nr:hypothetical protein GcM1_200037 [Golovinomyces cichoracearum]